MKIPKIQKKIPKKSQKNPSKITKNHQKNWKKIPPKNFPPKIPQESPQYCVPKKSKKNLKVILAKNNFS